MTPLASRRLRKTVRGALVTGAGGEMGHALLHRLDELGEADVIAVDVRPLEPELSRRYAAALVGDVLGSRAGA